MKVLQKMFYTKTTSIRVDSLATNLTNSFKHIDEWHKP